MVISDNIQYTYLIRKNMEILPRPVCGNCICISGGFYEQ